MFFALSGPLIILFLTCQKGGEKMGARIGSQIPSDFK